MTFSETTLLRQSDNIVTRNQLGEVLLVPVRNDVSSVEGFLFLLPDPVSVRIWELLADPVTVGELTDRIGDEFEADPSTVAADIRSFLSQLDAIDALDRPAKDPR